MQGLKNTKVTSKPTDLKDLKQRRRISEEKYTNDIIGKIIFVMKILI